MTTEPRKVWHKRQENLTCEFPMGVLKWTKISNIRCEEEKDILEKIRKYDGTDIILSFFVRFLKFSSAWTALSLSEIKKLMFFLLPNVCFIIPSTLTVGNSSPFSRINTRSARYPTSSKKWLVKIIDVL